MGYRDAMKDGIRLSGKNEPRGYYPRCQFCGAELFSMNYRSDIRYTCNHCKPMKKLLLAAGLFPKHERKCD